MSGTLNNNTKVYVGMSGGVDSSVAAALLKDQGYDVTGVYMKNWTKDLPGMQCPWAEDLSDAKRVAVQLGIPFKVFDFETEYKQKVVDYMVNEYAAGRTPNPDIMCNQEVKFKLFLEAALADGADAIATGHYARSESGRLEMAADTNKDQTYFLYRVTEAALAHTLFPLGEYEKPRIREIATEKGLYTATKKDSQGICFVGKVSMRDFLSQYIQGVPGDIIDVQTGKIVGRHDGAIFYTIGQRHGLGLGGGLPLYVARKDMIKNIVYVTAKLNDTALWDDRVALQQVHWINEAPIIDKEYRVRLRHRATLIVATFKMVGDEGETAQLVLHDEERAVTPGQSVVVYDGETVVGGGVVA